MQGIRQALESDTFDAFVTEFAHKRAQGAWVSVKKLIQKPSYKRSLQQDTKTPEA